MISLGSSQVPLEPLFDHLEDGLLDLRAVLEGGSEGAHGRAGDEGAHDATVVLQLQADNLKGKMTCVKRFLTFLEGYETRGQWPCSTSMRQ